MATESSAHWVVRFWCVAPSVILPLGCDACRIFLQLRRGTPMASPTTNPRLQALPTKQHILFEALGPDGTKYDAERLAKLLEWSLEDMGTYLRIQPAAVTHFGSLALRQE